MKEFKDKLSDLLKEKGINTIQFADILGISQPLVSQWLAGEKRTKKHLLPLAKFSGYPIAYWLDDTIEKPTEAHKYTDNISSNSTKTVYIPFYKDGVVSAGRGAENDDFGEPELLPFNPNDLKIMFNVSPHAKLGIVPCFGNSMEPTIKESDLVVFCDDINQIEGAIYVCKYENEIFIKRIKKRPMLALMSDNKDYEPIIIEEELNVEILGRVVGCYAINSKRI